MELAGPVCASGCAGLVALVLVAFVVLVAIGLCWVAALAWWLQGRGWRRSEAWSTALLAGLASATVAPLVPSVLGSLLAFPLMRAAWCAFLLGPLAAVVGFRRRSGTPARSNPAERRPPPPPA